MTTFVMISRHSPESCPNFNEKVRKSWIEFYGKSDELLKKYGIKNVGTWILGAEHTTLMVMEAPSYEALAKCMMEPAAMALGASETVELKSALNLEEVMKMLQQVK